MKSERRPFLTAAWRHLVMLNYETDPRVLAPYVPGGTVLDTWEDRHYVSLVAFRFLDTRGKGVSIPFHQDFDEVNLRFYVKRKAVDGWRRGVVFIKEVVPKWAIAAVARWAYNENYVSCPMRSSVNLDATGSGTLAYSWRPRGLGEITVSASVVGPPRPLVPGSEAEFITEHYWGYAAQTDGGTVEYRVDHPSWETWHATETTIAGPAREFYGEPLGGILEAPPVSGFVAAGSEVTVRQGARLDPESGHAT